MSREHNEVFAFGPFRLDATERLLFEGGVQIALAPKALQTLLLLVQRRGRLVEKSELLKIVWPDTYAEEGTLAQNIFTLRKQLREGDGGIVYIETVPKRGYRFVAPVTVHTAQAELVAAAPVIATQGAESRLMLVVLPIDNLSGNADSDFMSDGFTEAIISEIGSFNPEQLGVIARTSAMTYKATKKTVREVAAELNVQYLLEGSLRHSHDRLMVTTQLIRASDQTQLWAKNYERPLHDVLRVQSEVAAAVAHEISIRLTVRREPPAAVPTVDPVVYELYMRGRYSWNKRTEEGLRQAIEYYERAIAIDPHFARAHCGLASCWTWRGLYGNHALKDALPKAKVAALRALELEPRLSEAHSALGLTVTWLEYDWVQGERELLRGIETDPNSAMAYHWYAVFLSLLARHEEALQQVRMAVHFDPVSPNSRMIYGVILDMAGHYNAAIEEHEKVLAQTPRHYITRVMLGTILCRMACWEEAIGHLQLAYEHSGFQPDLLAHIGAGYAAAGMRQEALEVLDQLAKTALPCSPYFVARVHAGLGNIDATVALIEQAYEERLLLLASSSNDFFLQPARHDPRFQAVIAKMRFPQFC